MCVNVIKCVYLKYIYMIYIYIYSVYIQCIYIYTVYIYTVYNSQVPTPPTAQSSLPQLLTQTAADV